ncbi:hypothetical protein QCA50_018466 [Cerrena zonata]|uniref:Uncharacterized protein n=1 Tax=Cerrena zonata TaxID=2478898 RepID=A0AAW0FK93_9APHY
MPVAMQYPDLVVDDENPFYCPSIPALSFLETVRQKIYIEASTHRQKSARTPDPAYDVDQLLFPSFHNMLDRSLDEEDLLQLHYLPRNASNLPTRLRHDSSSSSLGTDHLHSGPSWRNTADRHGNRPLRHETARRSSKPVHIRTSDSFSEFQGPFRRQRSSMSVNEGSFELSAKAARLHFFPTRVAFSPYDLQATSQDHLTDRVRLLEDELYGPQIGTESPRGLKTFISRLASVLPGVRLKERLRAQEANTHQKIVDVLSMDGNLNARVLDLLRMSEIRCLDLAASMTDEEGLNLDARDLLHVLSKPNSFLFLTEINLSGAQLQDGDMKQVHHLPRLARLWISNTGIGNEAIFHLVALKRSLTELDIAFNTDIDDDVVPALILLYKLRFLTLLDTRVGMPGLRRFCAAAIERPHTMEMEVPRQCEIYVEKMGSKYVLQPEAPLISDPNAVSDLSIAALRRNLAAHAQYNPEIATEGTQHEMAERLKILLSTREADLVVRNTLWKGEDGDDDSSTEVF